MSETIHEIVQRISLETRYPFDDVYRVYCSNGDEKLTREILNISCAGNISPSLLSDACRPAVVKALLLYPSRWTRIKLFFKRLFK